MTSLVPFSELLSLIVDNRGKTCPVDQNGIPLIATNCVKNATLFPVFEKVRYVSDETYATWFRGHPKPGDLIFVTKGAPGQVCLAPDPVNFCIAQDMVAVRANDELVYPLYLFAALRSESVQNEITNMHVGTLIPHFKKGDFDKLKIPVPSRKSQVFIGDLYFDLSRKIELARQTNETLEAIARAIFKDWFVDFGPTRAKAEGRTPYLTPELWKLFPDVLDDEDKPLGWTHGFLGEYVEIFDSKRIPLSSRERHSRQGDIPYHGATGVMDHVDDYLFDGVHVLLGEDGSVIKEDGTPFTQYVWGRFWVNNHAHVLQGKGISNELLLCFLKQANITRFVSGAVQLKLNQKNLKRIPFLFSGPDTSAAFDDIVTPLFQAIRSNLEESRILAKTRDILLPKLISGEIHLAEASQAVEAIA